MTKLPQETKVLKRKPSCFHGAKVGGFLWWALLPVLICPNSPTRFRTEDSASSRRNKIETTLLAGFILQFSINRTSVFPRTIYTTEPNCIRAPIEGFFAPLTLTISLLSCHGTRIGLSKPSLHTSLRAESLVPW